VKEIIESIETQLINLTSCNNSLESRITDLEKENSQLKTRNNILTEKINAIDEEYSNKFEEYENMMVDKMDEINEHVSTMDNTCNCSHSEIANFEFNQLDIKDTTILDDNVSAAKADNHNEEIKCIICEKKFKSVSNLDKHDRKLHMTKELVPRYRCFHCTKISQNKKNLCDHMTTEHKICLICEKVFLSELTLDNHKKVNHRSNFYKHSLERDPSMKNQ
jgi:hypothetical protein